MDVTPDNTSNWDENFFVERWGCVPLETTWM